MTVRVAVAPSRHTSVAPSTADTNTTSATPSSLTSAAARVLTDDDASLPKGVPVVANATVPLGPPGTVLAYHDMAAGAVVDTMTSTLPSPLTSYGATATTLTDAVADSGTMGLTDCDEVPAAHVYTFKHIQIHIHTQTHTSTRLSTCLEPTQCDPPHTMARQHTRERTVHIKDAHALTHMGTYPGK